MSPCEIVVTIEAIIYYRASINIYTVGTTVRAAVRGSYSTFSDQSDMRSQQRCGLTPDCFELECFTAL